MPDPTTGHVWCCCDPQVCPLMCTFASSYAMGGMSGTLNAVWQERVSVDCPLCSAGTDADIVNDYELGVTWNQTGSVTLTRYATSGGGCCYAASGNLAVNWSFRSAQDLTCCAGNPAYVCSLENTYTGSDNVPFCYTVVCAQVQSVNYWLHSLTVCDFSCQVIDQLDEACSDPTCDALPIERVGLRLLGARYSWYSTMKAPNLLLSIDWTAIGVCGPLAYCGIEYAGQDPENTNETCMNRVAQDTLTFGPFSPIFVADWGSGPEPIDCSNTSEPFRKTFWNCNDVIIGCADNLANVTPCCDYGMSSTWFYPVFT